ncbi:AroM family protein [Lysinibacillus sp. KU-BSD001]|uniref:AroM family protein n=1 Tax=Lysinibacillus sp. KU-BSD001 TaxID=3141328 RepID=UPI0036EAEFC9
MSIGFVTLGTTPRVDLEQVIVNNGYEKFEIIGALDNLTQPEIEEISSISGNTPLFVRTNFGSYEIERDILIPYIEKATNELHQKGYNTAILLCSAAFPVFSANIPVVLPTDIIEKMVKSTKQQPVLVCVPIENQISFAQRKWSEAGIEAIVHTFNPLETTAKEIQYHIEKTGAKQVVLDCISYSSELHLELQQLSDTPIWNPLKQTLKHFK